MIVLSDFKENTDNTSSVDLPVVGYFFYGENKTSMIQDMIQDIETVKEAEVIVICDNDDKSMHLLTRKENGEFNTIDEAEKRVSFSEIEAWPTRKR